MKTKNVLGHIALKKENMGSRVRRLRILPKLLCLILAVVIWLLVVNLADVDFTKFAFFNVTPKYIQPRA